WRTCTSPRSARTTSSGTSWSAGSSRPTTGTRPSGPLRERPVTSRCSGRAAASEPAPRWATDGPGRPPRQTGAGAETIGSMSIDIANESGVDVDERELSRLARFVLDRMRLHPQAELSIVLVDEATMTEHHERWMDEPGPTDVLAFPMDELRPGRDGEEPPL